MTKINTRNAALNLLLEITDNKAYTNIALDRYFRNNSNIEKIDRAFITRLVEGTMEHLITIDYIINQFSKIKCKKMKKVILNLLRLSVYQMKYMTKVPVSAVCNEAVKLARKRGFNNLAGFVNGVLRAIARKGQSVKYPDEALEPVHYLSVYYSFPMWIIELWLKQYDYETVKVLCQNSNEIANTCIRTNTERIQPEQLKEVLEKEGVHVEHGHLLDYAFYISDYDQLSKLNAYHKGYFQVQDESSMLVTEVANPKENNIIVDVCAAPGGKTTHLAQRLNQTGKVISRDIYDKKLNLIRDNVTRLKLDNVTIENYDATKLDENLVQDVDIVVCDLPCSGLGIIRKKPDIKYNIVKEHLESLVLLQRKMLDVAQQYVKDDGCLIYSTCTINSKENEENVEWFLQNYPFELVAITNNLPEELGKQQTNKGYIQLLPGFNGTDGFFIAKLKRMKNSI